jgi:hypothetical protein
MLKHFKIDTTRHQKVVDVEFYQMNLITAVNTARKLEPELFINDGMFLPSWSKFAADPIRAKGFWTCVLQSIFEGRGEDDMNVDLQFRGNNVAYKPSQRVAMMFLSINNDELEIVAELTRDALKGFEIVPVGGAFGIKNETAEQHTKERIETAKRDGKNVLILSGGMAQRSYSIPEITELYLAYDGGEAGATIQKMCRALTDNGVGKIGRIVSLSFDPNRDDKFDAMILTTAQNYAKTHGLNLEDALRKVIATVDIFRCTDDGRDRLEFDTYLQQLLTNNSLSRVIGKTADITKLDDDMIEALANGNAEYFRNKRVATADKGKTHVPGIPTKRPPFVDDLDVKEWERMMKKAREVVVTIAENIDILVYGTGMKSIDETLELINNDITLQQVVARKFGVEYNVIRFMFDYEVINCDLVELMWNVKC